MKYATWWIRQAITRAIAEKSRTVRLPVHIVATANKLAKITQQLEQKLGREPLLDEITEEMGINNFREQTVLRHRFGLDDEGTRTLEEIGQVFNVSRERIRQIEGQALRKLKHPARRKHLNYYDL